MSKRFLSSLALALPLAAAFLWIGSEAIARRATAEPDALAQAGSGTKVAVVNLMKVLKGTESGAKWTVHLNDLQRVIDEETKTKKDDLKRLEDEVKKESDAARRDSMTDELMRKSLLAEEWLKLKKGELDRERSLHWQDLYRSLRTEVKTIATQNGIDVVFFDDGIDEIKVEDRQNQSRESQAFSQMLSVHVIYASDKVDITDQVITRMNNAAGSGASSPAGATGTSAKPTGSSSKNSGTN